MFSILMNIHSIIILVNKFTVYIYRVRATGELSTSIFTSTSKQIEREKSKLNPLFDLQINFRIHRAFEITAQTFNLYFTSIFPLDFILQMYTTNPTVFLCFLIVYT